MRLSKVLIAAAGAVALFAGAAPATAVAPKAAAATLYPPGTYNWYDGPQHHNLVGYMIVECDGTIHGPYPGPGRPWAEISEYEEYIPLEC